jgi:hypothetical protein
MAKIFENRQLLHVVSEVVILMALTYNISSKFKTVKSYIDDICHRLDEQEEMITRQTQQIDSLTSELKKLYAFTRGLGGEIISEVNPTKIHSQPKVRFAEVTSSSTGSGKPVKTEFKKINTGASTLSLPSSPPEGQLSDLGGSPFGREGEALESAPSTLRGDAISRDQEGEVSYQQPPSPRKNKKNARELEKQEVNKRDSFELRQRNTNSRQENPGSQSQKMGIASRPQRGLERSESLNRSSNPLRGFDQRENGAGIEQSILSSLTFIPMMGTNPFQSSSTNMATVEEMDSDEELDQELQQELEELSTTVAGKQDLKDTLEFNTEIQEDDV